MIRRMFEINNKKTNFGSNDKTKDTTVKMDHLVRIKMLKFKDVMTRK